MRSALLIIDLQNDFTRKDGKLPACIEQMEQVIESINRAVARRNAQQELSAAVITQWSNPIIRILTKNSVKPGTHGAELDARLNPGITNCFTKSNKDIFSSKDLTEWLQANHVEEIILSGLALEYCIKTSAIAAINRGYSVSVLRDGVASYQCKNREKRLEELLTAGAKIHAGSEG
ncbi:cysteine hydrolase [Cerasicoccus fimbriatus]|uniref:cysteine hydrolase n=1 Tax=Cerasicoccus fimbriatus TaxID=3014554 RepID=UPI0022B55F2A|nr:cysteine hydrolase [Cerasicoccus sp. TK19100]